MATQRVKDIATRFRRASTSRRIPYRDRLRYWAYYIALAHRGVMVPSTTRDALYEDGFLKRGYDTYCEKINRRLASGPAPSGDLELPCFEHGELEAEDLRLLMGMRIPFVLRDGARGLPVKDWSLDYLDQVAGACTVPINEAADRPSTDVSRPTKANHYYDFRMGTLGEVTASIRSGGRMRVSAAEDVMHHDESRLRRDLDLPYWERVSGWEANQRHWLRSRLFIGKISSAQLLVQPPKTYILWHAEPGDNFFVLARGSKNWALVHPLYSAAMRPRVKTTTNYVGSNIDDREADDVQRQRGFEGYLKIPKARVQMQAGDVLRVPNHWWHTAETPPDDYSLAASIRAESGPNLTGPGFMIMRRFDRQFDAIVQSLMEHGRIADKHIGYPRKSRSA